MGGEENSYLLVTCYDSGTFYSLSHLTYGFSVFPMKTGDSFGLAALMKCCLHKASKPFWKPPMILLITIYLFISSATLSAVGGDGLSLGCLCVRHVHCLNKQENSRALQVVMYIISLWNYPYSDPSSSRIFGSVVRKTQILITPTACEVVIIIFYRRRSPGA